MCPAVKAPEQLVLVGVLPVTLITYKIEAEVWDSAQDVVSRSASLKLRLEMQQMRIQPLGG